MLICCEGPRCNNGTSAKARENAIVAELGASNAQIRLEVEKDARMTVTKQLRLTEHARLERTAGGYIIFACCECGHERVYGTSVRTYFGLAYPAEEGQ